MEGAGLKANDPVAVIGGAGPPVPARFVRYASAPGTCVLVGSLKLSGGPEDTCGPQQLQVSSLVEYREEYGELPEAQGGEISSAAGDAMKELGQRAKAVEGTAPLAEAPQETLVVPRLQSIAANPSYFKMDGSPLACLGARHPLLGLRCSEASPEWLQCMERPRPGEAG